MFFFVSCELVSFFVVWALVILICVSLFLVVGLISGAKVCYYVVWSCYFHNFWLFIDYLKLSDFCFVWSLNSCRWIMIILIGMVGTLCG